MDSDELFERHPRNPIIVSRDVPYPCDCVMNPGATMQDDDVLLLLRVMDQRGASHLTIARSKDGVDQWRIEDRPFIAPNHRTPYEVYGCEDARVAYLPDRKEYVITYTGFSPLGAGVCLATTRDFKSVHRVGLVLAPNNKDAAVFPRQIGGRYWMLHRPTLGTLEHIWLTESIDLIHWGCPACIIEERGGPWWDGEKVGNGPPPIETPEGWLIIFHGVKQTSHGPIYRAGLALLDLDSPHKVIRRLPRWIFGPKASYETTGYLPGVVFPTGTIVKDGLVHLYYGAADTRVCLATAKVQDLLDALHEEGK
jgi:predicted GH43/DUF377 family glycosyl hydrolase